MKSNFTPRTYKNVMSFLRFYRKMFLRASIQNPRSFLTCGNRASQAPFSSCSFTISRAFTSLVDRESFLEDRERRRIETIFADLGFSRCDNIFTEDVMNDIVLLQVLCSLASDWSVYFDLFHTYRTFHDEFSNRKHPVDGCRSCSNIK